MPFFFQLPDLSLGLKEKRCVKEFYPLFSEVRKGKGWGGGGVVVVVVQTIHTGLD